MAFLAINLRCLLFLLLLWSIVALSFSEDTTVTTTTPTTTLLPFQKTQKENYFKYFKYLSRGIDIATASLEDIGREPTKAWKKPIWKDCGTAVKFEGGSFPKGEIANFQVPNFLEFKKLSKAEFVPYSAIYQTIDDLLKLLGPLHEPGSDLYELSHELEQFENRFRETTPAKEKTINGLAIAKVVELSGTVLPGLKTKDMLNKDFKNAVEKLIANKKSFQSDPKSYLDFTSAYGTHYATEASFGGILMLNSKVSMNNEALKRNKTLLEQDIQLLIEAVLNQNKQFPADAKPSTDLLYEPIFFGGTASSQKEETFLNEMQLNRTLSRVIVEPLWDLINITYKEENPEIVIEGLQKVEEVQLFRYELYRWKAAFEVAKASEFQQTALGYRDVTNLTPYLDYYLKNTTKMPYPKKGNETDVWATHLSQMFQWPLEYQIGLRGSLAF